MQVVEQTHLNTLIHGLADDPLLGGGKVLKLKDFTILQRQVLVWVPGTGTEATEAAVPLEAGESGNVAGGIDLVGERGILLLSFLALLKICLVPRRVSRLQSGHSLNLFIFRGHVFMVVAARVQFNLFQLFGFLVDFSWKNCQ
jgi:hypothetical protein